MAQQIINVGAAANDGTGDTLRGAFIKTDENFDELYTNRISGVGTDNYVPRFNGTNALENSQIFDNGTNVGIGTNTPSSTLQVGNGIGIKNIFISGAGSSLALGGLSVSFLGFSSGTISTINTSGSVPLGVGTRSTQPLVLGTNNAERMRIDSSGNVGIGTTSPSGKLDVVSTSDVYQNIITSGNGFSSVLSMYNSSGNTDGAAIGYNVAMRFGTITGVNAAGFTERMRITSSGNVGIGTTSPATQLHLNGSAELRFTNPTNTSGFDIGLLGGGSDANTYIYQRANSSMVFGTNNVERLRITSSGNVGIGTTSPSYKLQVKGNGFAVQGDNLNEGNSIRFLRDSGTEMGYIGWSNESTNNSTWLFKSSNGNPIGFSADNTNQNMVITTGGNVVIGTLGTGLVYSNAGTLTSTNPSDERLKNNITDLNYGLNEILKLRPVTYNWKNDTINQGKQFGFIAQEVQQIMPDLITEFTTIENDEEVIRLGLDKEAIFVAMVNAIKELTNRINNLENK